MAPPPPPPPGLPPPPLASPPPAVDPKNRSALLSSIRSGTTLKKTVTNDRSAPLVAGKANGLDNSHQGRSGGGGRLGSNFLSGVKGSATIARSNGLAGLFAEGMPKLRPTGIHIGSQQSSSLSCLNEPSQRLSSSNNSINSSSQYKSNGVSNLKMEVGKRTIDTKNRGPPPQPPAEKPVLPTSISDNRLSVGGSHTRSHSTVSLPNGGRPRMKPQLAPKPPAPAPPVQRKTPTRAHSMRAPASPPVIPPTNNGAVFPSGELGKSSYSLHSSTDSLVSRRGRPLEKPPPPPRGHLMQPPSIMLQAPSHPLPPPPPTIPPPNIPPPQPPAKSLLHSASSRIAPPLPSTPPPPPPTRHSSIRHPLTIDYESRFVSMFHSIKDFPPPQTFIGVAKVYNSKTAKQPAPAPPTHLQLTSKMWSNDSSTC